MRVLLHCWRILTNPNWIVKGNELSCFSLKAPDKMQSGRLDWTVRASHRSEWERIVVSLRGPFDSSGLRMSQGLLSMYVSQSSENASSCSHDMKLTTCEITSRLHDCFWSIWLQPNEERFRGRVAINPKLSTSERSQLSFQLPDLSVLHLYQEESANEVRDASPPHCPALCQHYSRITPPCRPSPSHFLPLWVANKSEASENQTVNSTHRAKDIIRHMNFAFSVDNTFIT